MKYEWKELENTAIEIIDGDRGKNYPNTKDFTDEGYCLFLNAKNVTNNGFIFNKNTFITQERDILLRKGKLQFEDIVLTTRGTVGNVAYYNHTVPYQNMRINSGMVIIRPNKKFFNSEYVYWLFRSNIIQNQILQYISGTAQPQLPISSIKKIIIPVISLEDQSRVATILGTVQSKIELNNKINENLLAQADLLYDQIFSDEKIFTELGNVIETTSGGTPSRKHPELYENPSICWVKSKELNGGFIHTTEEMINEIALSKSAAKMLPAHCVLVAMYGATVGEYGIIASPMTCNQAVCALIPNNRYPYPYLYELIRHSKEKLKNMAVGSAQQNISQVLIKQLPVHTNFDKVEQFAEAAIASFQMIETLTLENIRLTLMRDTLIPKLMSGEIDITKIDAEY